ncbi:MAG: hypothetical protein VKK03_03415 [Synechococcus sp.]|nr:hypothetical protein [Synechococcus sp.]
MYTSSMSSSHQREGDSPACQLPPKPRVIQALLSLAWRHPRSERPAWLRAEVGEPSES